MTKILPKFREYLPDQKSAKGYVICKSKIRLPLTPRRGSWACFSSLKAAFRILSQNGEKIPSLKFNFRFFENPSDCLRTVDWTQ